MMLRSLLLTGLCLASLAACSEPSVSRQYALETCESVRVQGAFGLLLSVSDTPSLTAVGSAADVELLQVEIARNLLTIGLVSTESPGLSAPADGLPVALQLELHCPNLRELALIGAVHAQDTRPQAQRLMRKISSYGQSRFQTESIAADVLEIRSGGDSVVNVGQMIAEHVLILASGASRVTLVGESATVEAEVSGQARVAADQLRVQTAAIELRGQGQLSMHVSAHLNGHIEGASILSYLGAPDVAVETTGAAQLKRL